MDIGLLNQHVDAFNQGVRLKDFSSMMELFSQAAVMEFENIPVGPFSGKESIAQAYAAQPPSDEIVILRSRFTDDFILAEFAWKASPQERGGDLVLFAKGDKIEKLIVVYGGSPYRWKGLGG